MNIVIPAGNAALNDFIVVNQLNPMATDCLLRCTPDIQAKVMSRGPCDPKKVRDQVAVIKKRIQHAQLGRATGICGQEVEAYIANQNFDEKAKDLIRTSANQVQRIVLDRGPISGANPSAELLVRVRDAHKSAVFMDGRPRPQAPDRGYGESVAGGKKRSAMALESESGVPVVTWLSFGANSHFVQAGFDGDGPAILHNKRDPILKKGWEILEQVVMDQSTIQVEHDEKWEKFPGMGEAFKRETGEENCFAVATCTEHGKWAVGFHYGHQGREEAAKLALAVAIILGTSMENKIGTLFPDFAIICDESAIGRDVAKAGMPNFNAPSTSSQVNDAAAQVAASMSARTAEADLKQTRDHAPPAAAQFATEQMAAAQVAAEWQMQMQMAAASSMAAFGHAGGPGQRSSGFSG